MVTSIATWLTYLAELNPQRIVLGLDRVSQVAARLSLTNFTCPVVTVTGTNGKGSCIKILESILMASGYRVAAYTSPHLLYFNERIRLNGQAISDQALCDAFAAVAAAKSDTELTYFEFTTLAALWWFHHAGPDVVLLEVGLGGRLDAVNIIDPDVAVITTIDLDHTELLGPNRDSIGWEKAGIFRFGRPAVFGDLSPVSSVVQYAAELHVPLYQLNHAYHFQESADSWSWWTQEQQWEKLPKPKLPLQNAATALMALNLLQQKLIIPTAAIINGLKHATLPGRLQSLPYQSKEIILDVAHNPAASRWLANQLAAQPSSKGKTHAVFAIMGDKDIRATLTPLLPQIATWHIGNLQEARAAESGLILQTLQEIGGKECYNYPTIEAAFAAACKDSQPGDRILVFGSFHTVAAVQHQLSTKY